MGMKTTATEIDTDALKSAALAARAVAIVADDSLAQREAEQAFNAALAIEAGRRSAVSAKGRVTAEKNAEQAGWDAAANGAGPEGELHVGKTLRACWRKGWEAYYSQPEAVAC